MLYGRFSDPSMAARVHHRVLLQSQLQSPGCFQEVFTKRCLHCSCGAAQQTEARDAPVNASNTSN